MAAAGINQLPVNKSEGHQQSGRSESELQENRAEPEAREEPADRSAAASRLWLEAGRLPQQLAGGVVGGASGLAASASSPVLQVQVQLVPLAQRRGQADWKDKQREQFLTSDLSVIRELKQEVLIKVKAQIKASS